MYENNSVSQIRSKDYGKYLSKRQSMIALATMVQCLPVVGSHSRVDLPQISSQYGSVYHTVYFLGTLLHLILPRGNIVYLLGTLLHLILPWGNIVYLLGTLLHLILPRGNIVYFLGTILHLILPRGNIVYFLGTILHLILLRGNIVVSGVIKQPA